MNDTTVIIAAIEKGEPKAAEQLLSLVYEQLRHLAASKLAPGQTLQPTALVHEAWLKLVGDQDRTFQNRTHFFRAAAEAMRHILIDRARRKQTQRHGGEFVRIDLEGIESDLALPDVPEILLALNEALGQLGDIIAGKGRTGDHQFGKVAGQPLGAVGTRADE
ncbi:MAG TPA: ECF-type sigma factor [Verrucomicrobiae bacterium]|jgi:RNA polymerase sigma factor (TIGR02999 family)